MRIVSRPSGRDGEKNRKTNGHEEAKEGESGRGWLNCTASAILGAACRSIGENDTPYMLRSEALNRKASCTIVRNTRMK